MHVLLHTAVWIATQLLIQWVLVSVYTCSNILYIIKDIRTYYIGNWAARGMHMHVYTHTQSLSLSLSLCSAILHCMSICIVTDMQAHTCFVSIYIYIYTYVHTIARL